MPPGQSRQRRGATLPGKGPGDAAEELTVQLQMLGLLDSGRFCPDSSEMFEPLFLEVFITSRFMELAPCIEGDVGSIFFSANRSISWDLIFWPSGHGKSTPIFWMVYDEKPNNPKRNGVRICAHVHAKAARHAPECVEVAPWPPANSPTKWC